MKVLILAGGFGTRISEESRVIPKPMIEIGDRPIIWHIMKHFSHYGFNEFVILCGYKGHVIKEYFTDYYLHNSSLTVDLRNNSIDFFNSHAVEPWKVTCLDTGISTLTAGRIEAAKSIVGDQPFWLTYGDGVTNAPLSEILYTHRNSKKSVTITAVRPEGRFGRLEIDSKNEIQSFNEKPIDEGGWINGGFMICNPNIFDFIANSQNITFERDPLEKMSSQGMVGCYRHAGFWKCMDTLSDKQSLQKLWEIGKAPWKTW